MDIQEDNDPWGNIVDALTCLDHLDYLGEGEVVEDVGDVEDDGNIPN